MKKPQNPIEVLLIGLCVLSIGIAFGLSEGGVALTGSVPGRGTFNPGGMAVASSDSIHAIGFVGIFLGISMLPHFTSSQPQQTQAGEAWTGRWSQDQAAGQWGQGVGRIWISRNEWRSLDWAGPLGLLGRGR